MKELDKIVLNSIYDFTSIKTTEMLLYDDNISRKITEDGKKYLLILQETLNNHK